MSFAIFLFVLTSIAATKFLAKSVWMCAAKSSAVLLGGSRKQSGRILPWLSPSLPTPPGKIVMYLNNSSTAVSRAFWTPVLPCLSRTFSLMNISAFFCFSLSLSLISKFDSPGMYLISPAFAASLSASSESPDVGMIMYSGNSFLHRSRFAAAVGRSILLATIIIGFVFLRTYFANASKFSSVQSAGFSGFSFRLFIASSTIGSVTFSPLSCFARAFASFAFSCCTVLANLSHPLCMMFSIHMSSSISKNLMSNAGS